MQRRPRPLRRPSRLIATTAAVGLVLGVAPAAFADTTPQALPFSQDWADTALISAANDWSGVPGIIGYRGDSLVSAPGADPQTILADGAATPVNVIANSTTPNTLATGGVAEFQITDPVVALQGSGTADAPHIVIRVDNTGRTDTTVRYTVRDVDSNADNAIQQVALQYRVGGSGPYTNVPEAYLADASVQGATLDTPVAVVLPDATDGAAVLDLRVITADAAGSDEWVGIDNILVGGPPVGEQPLAVTDANPATIESVPGAAFGPETYTASDPDDDITDATTTALPTGVTFDAGTTGGTRTVSLSGDGTTPAGTYPVTITFTNADGATVDVGVTIIVEAACAATPTHEIGAVQGSGATTPLFGTTVTVRGVVVGDVPGISGFYLQDPDGDGDDATSDGIFVFSPVAVGLGDTVQVTGNATEFSGQTQVSAGQSVDVCAPAPADPISALPPATSLDLPADPASFERYEGMRVSPVDVLTVSEVFDLTRFGELTLSEGGLLVQPTELGRPGPEAQAVAADNARRRIVLDDGSNASRSVTNRPYLSPTTPVRVGDELTFTSPLVLGFGFGSWRLQPADGTPEGTFAPQNTRTPAPDPVGGDITVGAFNVLNYFLTRTGDDARGATTDEAFERQAAKIVAAIVALDADVVALMEVEDTNSTDFDGATPNADLALADLVARINADGGAGTYAYVPLPDELYAVDRDVIRTAIIYRTASVTALGDPVGLVDETVWSNAREPIAQTFIAQGDVFTVVANHFKSKSPGAPTGDNVDIGDGQGEWNGDRVRQAESLADFVADLQTSTGDTDVILMGDFNAYTQEDPIEALREAGFTDVGSELDPERYSYVFDDFSGSLDHALATASLSEKVTGAAHWNINAVESFAYQYTGDVVGLYAPHPYRSSDHDPLVVGIDLATPTLSIADAGSVPEGATASFTVSLSAPITVAVSVAVATAEGTATAGSDYTTTSTTATFAPGATTATVTVPTLGDTLDELDETFTATLGTVTGPATVVDGSGTATIVDDDPSPTVRAFDALVVEGNTGTRVVRVPVRLSTASGRPVTVAWSTQALTASAGSDFVAATGTVTFAPGQTQGFADVTIVGDRRLELPELFRVRLSAPSGATVAGNPALVLILDDDLFR